MVIDYPKKEFIDFDEDKSAEFLLSDDDAELLSEKVSFPKETVKKVIVCRKFNGKYEVIFPNLEDPSNFYACE